MSKNVEYRTSNIYRDVGRTQSQFARVGKLEEARMSERARHTGDGVARRKAHQERQRDEREQREEADRAAGTALPPEEGGVELVSADDVLKGVAETGPNYTLLPKRERKAKRRRRRRAAAEASGESASEDGMDGLHEAAAATAGATGRPCRATRGSGSM